MLCTCNDIVLTSDRFFPKRSTALFYFVGLSVCLDNRLQPIPLAIGDSRRQPALDNGLPELEDLVLSREV